MDIPAISKRISEVEHKVLPESTVMLLGLTKEKYYRIQRFEYLRIIIFLRGTDPTNFKGRCQAVISVKCLSENSEVRSTKCEKQMCVILCELGHSYILFPLN